MGVTMKETYEKIFVLRYFLIGCISLYSMCHAAEIAETARFTAVHKPASVGKKSGTSKVSGARKKPSLSATAGSSKKTITSERSDKVSNVRNSKAAENRKSVKPEHMTKDDAKEKTKEFRDDICKSPSGTDECKELEEAFAKPFKAVKKADSAPVVVATPIKNAKEKKTEQSKEDSATTQSQSESEKEQNK